MTIEPTTAVAILVWVVAGFCYAVQAGVNLERRRQRRRNPLPFSWACPRCTFHVAGDDPGEVLDATTDHERQAHL